MKCGILLSLCLISCSLFSLPSTLCAQDLQEVVIPEVVHIDGHDSCGTCDSCNSCGRCGKKRRNRRDAEGLDPFFNCNCQGSYKFPVPPLYTYHWIGIYSQRQMTDYHSPWRFPPLRPYTKELNILPVAQNTSPSLFYQTRYSNTKDEMISRNSADYLLGRDSIQIRHLPPAAQTKAPLSQRISQHNLMEKYYQK
ncbi:MAG: hypothetical protein MPJ24_10195 [Pirellulaceae bacterium]|nr:hypothetical protein [Pirellulaceae bacterium]